MKGAAWKVAAAAVLLGVPLVIWLVLPTIERRAATARYEQALADWQAAGGLLDLSTFKPAAIGLMNNAATNFVEVAMVFDATMEYEAKYAEERGYFPDKSPEELGFDVTPEEHRRKAEARIWRTMEDALTIGKSQFSIDFYDTPCDPHRYGHMSALGSAKWWASERLKTVQEADPTDAETVVRLLEFQRLLADAEFTVPTRTTYRRSRNEDKRLFDAVDTFCSTYDCDAAMTERIRTCITRDEDDAEFLMSIHGMVIEDLATVTDPNCPGVYPTDQRDSTQQMMIDLYAAGTLEIGTRALGLVGVPFHELSDGILDAPAFDDEEAQKSADRLTKLVAYDIRHRARDARIRSLLSDGFELRAIRRETGAYPETFEASTDPMTGEPFVYVRHDGGFRLSPPGEPGPDDEMWFALDWK